MCDKQVVFALHDIIRQLPCSMLRKVTHPRRSRVLLIVEVAVRVTQTGVNFLIRRNSVSVSKMLWPLELVCMIL